MRFVTRLLCPTSRPGRSITALRGVQARVSDSFPNDLDTVTSAAKQTTAKDYAYAFMRLGCGQRLIHCDWNERISGVTTISLNEGIVTRNKVDCKYYFVVGYDQLGATGYLVEHINRLFQGSFLEGGVGVYGGN